MGDTLFDGGDECCFIGNVAGDAKIIDTFKECFDIGINVECNHGSAAFEHRFDTCFADARGTTGDECDLALKLWRTAALA